MEEIANADSIGQNFYWCLVIKSRKKQGPAKHPIKVNGNVINELAKAWRDHNELYSPSNDESCDSDFKKHGENELHTMTELPKARANHVTSRAVTLKEIREICKKVKM